MYTSTAEACSASITLCERKQQTQVPRQLDLDAETNKNRRNSFDLTQSLFGKHLFYSSMTSQPTTTLTSLTNTEVNELRSCGIYFHVFHPGV